MQLVSGITHTRINGNVVALKGDCKISPQTITNETLVGEDGIHGAIQTPMAPGIEMTLTNLADIDFQALQADYDITVQLEFNNGQVVTLTGANIDGEISHNTKENEVTLTFKGNNIEYTQPNA